MPVTLAPRPARNKAVSPVPQPASRTEPVIRSATSMKGFCGLPMSQGAWPAYMASKVARSGTGVMVVLLRRLPRSCLGSEPLSALRRARGPLATILSPVDDAAGVWGAGPERWAGRRLPPNACSLPRDFFLDEATAPAAGHGSHPSP